MGFGSVRSASAATHCSHTPQIPIPKHTRTAFLTLHPSVRRLPSAPLVSPKFRLGSFRRPRGSSGVALSGSCPYWMSPVINSCAGFGFRDWGWRMIDVWGGASRACVVCICRLSSGAQKLTLGRRHGGAGEERQRRQPQRAAGERQTRHPLLHSGLCGWIGSVVVVVVSRQRRLVSERAKEWHSRSSEKHRRARGTGVTDSGPRGRGFRILETRDRMESQAGNPNRSIDQLLRSINRGGKGKERFGPISRTNGTGISEARSLG